MKDGDKASVAGCIFVGLWLLFGLAWVGFIVWAIVTVINWLVTK